MKRRSDVDGKDARSLLSQMLCDDRHRLFDVINGVTWFRVVAPFTLQGPRVQWERHPRQRW